MSDWRDVVPTVAAGDACPACGSREGGCIYFATDVHGKPVEDGPYHRPHDCTFEEPCGRISECRWCVDYTSIGLAMAEPEDAQ